jgi:putative tryptophan/tyrosine transport system substrate-binding protein
MSRRAIGLLVSLALGILMAPVVADAQPAAKVPRIGFFSSDSPGSEGARAYLAAFRQGLRKLGYVEGQTIAIEERFAAWRAERLAELAAELVRLNMEVIVTQAAPATQAAQHATSTIPIVMAHVGDPVGTGLVGSLARPGGNLTGVSVIGIDTSGKRLELLKEAVPAISRVASLVSPTNPGGERSLREVQAAAPALGVTLHPVGLRHVEELEQAFAAITTAQADAIFVHQDHLFFSHHARIVELVTKSRLPAVYMYREWAEAGGLMSYGASLRDVYRRVAALVEKILQGAMPGELPVEQVMKLELVLNLKTAQAQGLTIPPTLLFQADEVIR